MGRWKTRRHAAVVAMVGVLASFACAPSFDATRSPAPRGTIGQELFGVICDRVGAQSLTEDLSGASFHAVCHAASDGTYSSAVDESQLPSPQATTTASGQPVTLADALATRTHAVARVNALAQDRAKLIAAFDATLPDIQVPIKDTSNADASLTCQTPAASPTDALGRELADMLARFTPLYDDGTMPRSTESLARVFDAFQASNDALASYARLDAREGYRPLAIALGAVRPLLAYPELRDLANTTLELLSANTDPYASSPTPGAAYPEFTGLLGAAYQELRTATGDGPVPVLEAAKIDPLHRAVLSRPRTDLEFMQQLFYAEDPAFGGGPSRYIARRDTRGYAQVALANGSIPSPFIDDSGFAKIDALGQFVTANGAPAPSPFAAPEGAAAPAYDGFGRALTGPTGQLYYDYLDTSHTYAASLLNDLQGLVVPDPALGKETLMNALSGAYVLAGPRDASPTATKTYAPDPTAVSPNAPVTLAYRQFNGASSAMLDMVYGVLQTVPGPSNDDLLAYVSTLLTEQPAEVARLMGAGLAMKKNADAATSAHLPATSTLWDEIIDVAVQIEEDTTVGPTGDRLLEDILTALGDDRTPGLGAAFASFTKLNDALSYDRNDINGPPYNLTTHSVTPMQTPVDRTKPDTGANRSGFQRFLQIVHDTDGVTVCNKDGATVDAQLTVLGVTSTIKMPGVDPCDHDSVISGGNGTYPECAVYKIENAAAFYLDSIIGKASLYLRDDELREGIGTDGTLCPALGLEAATVSLMTTSSGITGAATGWSAFWDPPDSHTLRPTPQFLERQMFFDLANDSPNGSGPNALTNTFLTDLDGPNIGTSVCPERIIPDPNPTAPDASPDGLVHGLRACPNGDWLFQRDNNTIFVAEDFNFFASLTPLLTAFANHKREDLFIALLEALDRHWADAAGTADECKLSVDPKSPFHACSKDGVVSYEPLLVQQYLTDILPALHDLAKTLGTLKVPHCDAIDPLTHACSPTMVTGISVLAQGTRQLLDPKLAAATGLKDRHGTTTALRNDGTTNPQVTPLYLILEALNNMDAAFATYASAHPGDTQRLTAWRAARSKLVDQFLSTSGSGAASSFANASVPRILPVLVTALREQAVANCPASFSPPYPACAWVRQTLLANMQASMEGPLFASMMGLSDVIRQDDNGRTQLEAVLTYLLNASATDGSAQNDALPALLGAADDLVQVLRDDTNLVPFYHVAAEAARPSVMDAKGNVVQAGAMDASISLLSRLTARAYAQPASGSAFEDCAKEIDPNQVLTIALQHLVTPMTAPGPLNGQTPLQVIVDAVADVNRAAPGAASKLAPNDYLSIAANVSDFMSSKTSGLEQFYAIIRQGTE